MAMLLTGAGLDVLNGCMIAADQQFLLMALFSRSATSTSSDCDSASGPSIDTAHSRVALLALGRSCYRGSRKGD
jgi:hypothetical protein